jgi:hypothetical protein
MNSPAPLPPLRISADGRRLVTDDDRPFFWLADTAWELLHRLTRAEIDHYLADRAARRFTVIQTVLLAELDGLHTPNAEGTLPLHTADPFRPDEGYFTLADYALAAAARHQLRVALLPAWGSHVRPDAVIATPATAHAYGTWLGHRYGTQPHLVWVLGGDRDPAPALELWRALATGLRDGGATQLITYHPDGEASSSRHLHNEPWLDFNLIQSGHSRAHHPTWRMLAADRARLPAKPVIDAEPLYENIPLAFNNRNPRPTAAEVRAALYRATFAGGAGVTYGCNEVWQMAAPGRPPALSAVLDWRAALDLPVAGQVRHLRALVESRPWGSAVPDDTLEEPYSKNHDTDHACGWRDGDADGTGLTWCMIYLPLLRNPRPRTTGFAAARLRVSWFSPRDGRFIPAGEFPNTGRLGPPDHPIPTWEILDDGPDWVFLIDAA